jgi:SAM-dependent methyltransferase
MQLVDIVRRQLEPEPWSEGEKIPWNDPDFSRRMLQEHLSQAHNLASRRTEIIERQVAWIHQRVLASTPSRILDLGCGPGLYANRLAKLGHECVGVDFSPASIAYAREQAGELKSTYVEGDLRTADWGTDFGLAMFIFGEFNVFTPEDAKLILLRLHDALAPRGKLVLEVHIIDAVKRMGANPPVWSSAEQGLFSEQPHLYLCESFWNPQRAVATERYWVVDVQTGNVTRHATSTQAYTDDEYRAMLSECGFSAIRFYPSLTGAVEKTQSDFFVIVAERN